MANDEKIPGRGALWNPANRYELIHIERDEDEDEGLPATQYFRDSSRTILAENDSPDVPFRFSVNPYRGCEHGCVYCYARPSHEFLGWSAGLEFESRILVKTEAPELLRRAFSSPNWQPQTIAFSGNTDCYQPVERKLGLTRACLEVCAEFRNPVGIVTKSSLVVRDTDLLRALAEQRLVHVGVSVTTLDAELARRMEPRAATPARRLQAIRALSQAGVPVAVMLAPVIPGLNDEEIPAILDAAREAGARSASYVLLRLPAPVDALFESWLARHYPQRARRVLGRIRQCRDGRLNDARFGMRMRGEGVYAEQIRALFSLAVRKAGLDRPLPELDCSAFRRPGGSQLRLF